MSAAICRSVCSEYFVRTTAPNGDDWLVVRGFRGRVEGAEGLAASEGADWNDLGPDEQIAYYARARLNEET